MGPTQIVKIYKDTILKVVIYINTTNCYPSYDTYNTLVSMVTSSQTLSMEGLATLRQHVPASVLVGFEQVITYCWYTGRTFADINRMIIRLWIIYTSPKKCTPDTLNTLYLLVNGHPGTYYAYELLRINGFGYELLNAVYRIMSKEEQDKVGYRLRPDGLTYKTLNQIQIMQPAMLLLPPQQQLTQPTPQLTLTPPQLTPQPSNKRKCSNSIGPEETKYLRVDY